MELKLILESILFSAQKPLSLAELRECMKGAPEHVEEELPKELAAPKVASMEEALALLKADYDAMQRSYRLACVAGSWQFVSLADFAPWVKALVGHRPRPPRLSQAALETLAIVAYRQPLTRAEGEQIRGVAIDGVLKMLIDRGLVEPAGRAEVLGRPMTFRTTELFLEYFGLKDLDELPAADELRRIPVESPPPLTEAVEDQDDSNDEAAEVDSEEASDLGNDTSDDSADSGDSAEDAQSESPEDLVSEKDREFEDSDDAETDDPDDEEGFVDDEDEFEDDDNDEDWELDDSDDHDEADETEGGEDEETIEDELGDKETNLDNQHPEKEES
jgi:segregation and condensation protein B